jgi:hypothetical protein
MNHFARLRVLDRQRKHPYWLVTIFYTDAERFGRVYTDRKRAERFANRQKKSPTVKSTKIEQVG